MDIIINSLAHKDNTKLIQIMKKYREYPESFT